VDLREAGNSVGQRHPWETARYRFFTSELARAKVFGAGGKVLDVGSGDGWFAEGLAKDHFEHAQIVCFDVNYAEKSSQQAVGTNTVLKTNEPPTQKFSAVLLLDVLEHVEDDVGFLTGVVQNNLEEGGKVLISVPAWPQVWTPHDQFLKHFRRYTPAAALRLIHAAGLKTVRQGGLFHSLLPVRGLQRLLNTTKSDRPEGAWNAGRWVSAGFGAALGVDNWISRRLASAGLDVPGLSWWAMCER
jgi:SAM-dependent methyltransferase